MRTREIDLTIIDRVLQGYKKVPTDPPSLDSDRDAWEVREREKRYKAIDSKSGIIYLISNPAAWRSYYNQSGSLVRVRPAPQQVLTYAEAQKQAQETPKTQYQGYEGDY